MKKMLFAILVLVAVIGLVAIGAPNVFTQAYHGTEDARAGFNKTCQYRQIHDTSGNPETGDASRSNYCRHMDGSNQACGHNNTCYGGGNAGNSGSPTCHGCGGGTYSRGCGRRR